MNAFGNALNFPLFQNERVFQAMQDKCYPKLMVSSTLSLITDWNELKIKDKNGKGEPIFD